MRTAARLGVLAAVSLLLPAEADAQKTDVVILANGDRLTCEVQSLQRGLLEVKTDSISTINIEWADLVSVAADSLFEVEMTSGVFHYGRLASGQPRELVISGDTGSLVVDMGDVFRIVKLELGFWRRLDGNIDFGGSYTQSSGVGQASISSAIGARRPGFQWRFTYDTTVTVQSDDGGTDSRQNLQATYAFLLPDRWLIPSFAILERNQELGFDLRSTAGLAVGRAFVQSNRTVISGGGGLAYSNEQPVEGDSTSNLEAIIFASYEAFTYNFPKLDVRVAFTAFPGLSDFGRIRFTSQLRFKREFFSDDFYAALTFYDDYDSRPPAGATKTNDLGFTFSFGVSF